MYVQAYIHRNVKRVWREIGIKTECINGVRKIQLKFQRLGRLNEYLQYLFTVIEAEKR
jgi:hypothetical protein